MDRQSIIENDEAIARALAHDGSKPTSQKRSSKLKSKRRKRTVRNAGPASPAAPAVPAAPTNPANDGQYPSILAGKSYPLRELGNGAAISSPAFLANLQLSRCTTPGCEDSACNNIDGGDRKEETTVEPADGRGWPGNNADAAGTAGGRGGPGIGTL